MKIKGSTDGKLQTISPGTNKAGKSTAKRLSDTRKPTPKANKSTSSRPKRPGG